MLKYSQTYKISMKNFGYLGLSQPYETTYTDGRQVQVYPNGDIIPTNANTNKKSPQKPINYTKALIVPIAVGITLFLLTKGVDYFAEKR